ncbi:MAG: sulfite reductase subunit alpha [Verrucomicrobiales bacterium]
MSHPIVLPDDAPFTPEQRLWLGDFLSQVLGGGPGEAAAHGPAVPVTILWGSQTGNAEGCARKLAKAMKGGAFEPEVFDMADYDPARLPQEKNVLVITSTYGDGEPPDNAEALYNHIQSDAAAKMEGVKFSVLALGDTEYPDFCECGKVFDQCFEKLGAERIYELVMCDVDFDEPFAAWKKGVMDVLGQGVSVAATEEVEEAFDGYNKKHPFPAPVLKNYNLNSGDSERETYHIEISLDGSELEYEAGDALGVYPMNPESVVDEILENLPFNVNDEVPLPGGGEASLREALISSYDIRSLSRKILEQWQERSGSPYLRALVESDDKAAIDDFCWGRELIDLVVDHPADFGDAEEFVSVLKKLQPRLYSISSSPKAHPGEVHLTVAIVRYHSHGRDRGGVCSTFFADRIEGINPGVYVHHNKAFRLPENGDTPVIMCGPGTGVAPFRAFLEERKATGAKGANWLFFGNPHKTTDFLYQDEMEALQAEGVLQKLDLAFSRDQEHKIYVQDRILENGAELWQWFQDGAHFYVCGDASRMAKDVDAALHKVAMDHGGLSEAEAEQYISQLKKEKRYARDVY